MADFKIPVSSEERVAVAKAIAELGTLTHVKSMSRTIIANSASIKETKVRAVLQDMLDLKEIDQYLTTDNPKRQRYFFKLTAKGLLLLNDEDDAEQTPIT